MSSSSKVKAKNAYNHWTEEEKEKVYHMYLEIAEKIGPSNKIPSPTDAQLENFNSTLNLTNEK
jgi:hypothetical protein